MRTSGSDISDCVRSCVISVSHRERNSDIACKVFATKMRCGFTSRLKSIAEFWRCREQGAESYFPKCRSKNRAISSNVSLASGAV